MSYEQVSATPIRTMSNNINDGGPAFPVSTGTGPLSANFVSPGMSLRDYFAAQALQGILASMSDAPTPEGQWNIAREAYQFADQMIRQRSDETPR